MTAALLLLIFLAFGILLFSKRITVMLALPTMAILLAIVANVPGDYIIANILEEGPARLSPAIMATIFGGILAAFIKNQGVAEVLVRYAAELGGDHPLIVGIILMLVTALLFTAVSGLGAVVMVGTIILPAMLSIGMPPAAAGIVMLLGLAMGGTLNIVNWRLYMSLLQIDQAIVRGFMVRMFALYLIAGLAYCIWALRASQLHRFFAFGSSARAPYRRMMPLAPIMPLILVLFFDWSIEPAFLVAIMFAVLASNSEGEAAVYSLLVMAGNLWFIQSALGDFYLAHVGGDRPIWLASVYGLLLLLPYITWAFGVMRWSRKKRKSLRMKWVVLVPLLPLLMLHFMDVSFEISLIAGLLVAVFITTRPRMAQLLTKSMLEGIQTVAPALILILGIGMLMETVAHPNVMNALQTPLAALVPASPIPFVLVFALLAPLALYRGPFNVWGMGSAIAVILATANLLGSAAIMGALVSLGAMQLICDSTNTHNVWIASNVKVDAAELSRKALPFAWPLTIAGLLLAAVMFL